MDVFGVSALVFGSGLIAAAAAISGRRAQAAVWLQAGQSAGLDELSVRSWGGWPRCVEGRHGALAVRIESLYDWYAKQTATRIEIRGLATSLALRASKRGPFAAQEDIQVGDHPFDEAIAVTGSSQVAIALLDARTRDLVRDLFAERATVQDNDTRLERGVQLYPGRLVAERVLGDQPVWIASYLRDLLALAERLQEPDDLPARLLLNLREDPNPTVRRTLLQTLLREHPGHPVSQQALRLGLEDLDEDVRLEAALALGSEGRAALLAIATTESPLDGNAARAVTELRSALTAEQARGLLARALRARHVQTAQACLESLSRRGPEQAEVIGRVLTIEEGPLAAAAARALGRVGGAPEIVLLRESEARRPRDAQLREASREAVAAIRSRLVGAEEGQVSLSAAEPGRVSLATDQAGRVSLPGNPREPD